MVAAEQAELRWSTNPDDGRELRCSHRKGLIDPHVVVLYKTNPDLRRMINNIFPGSLERLGALQGYPSITIRLSASCHRTPVMMTLGGLIESKYLIRYPAEG